jgi:outer membrane immunogenic protein
MRNSKFIVSAAAAAISAILGIGAASAADMAAAPRYTKAPPMAPVVYNWTGCYIGGNVGGGWAKQNQFRVDSIGVGPTPQNYGSESDSAFIGGGQIGCDYQFAGSWVVGVQGMFDWGNISGSHASGSFGGVPLSGTMFDKTKYIDTATVRLGYLFAPQVLGYVKGGAAWTNSSDALFGVPGNFLSEQASWSSTGWTVGGGVEWMFAPGWSVFGEYNYMDFGTKLVTFIAPPGFVPPGEHINVSQTAQTALFGLNYKFNWGGPVVAKY